MDINTDSYFMGAYQQRVINQNTFQFNNKNNMNGRITEEIEKRGIADNPAVSVSLSEESKRLLLSKEGADKLQKDVEELYQKNAAAQIENGSTDEFAVKGTDQWLIFSEYLYKNGFYDNMSDEEVKNTEQLLMQVTDGMDDVFSWEHNAGIDLYDEFHGKQLDSGEANLELESSTAALKYFSENLVDETDRAGFNELIDKYYSHNSDLLNDGYMSIEEKFNVGRSRLPEGVKEKLEKKRSAENQRSEQAAKELAIRDILGGITHSAEDSKSNNSEIASLFAQMNQENQSNIMQQIKDKFLKFVTNGSDNEAVKEHINKHAEHVFSNINDYWTELMKAVV